MIWQTEDPNEVHQIINHPDVFPSVSDGRLWPLDVTPLMVEDNIFIMAEGGGFAFIRLADFAYEGHYYFLPQFRGRYAINTAKECLNWFAPRDITLLGRTPLQNKSARLFNKLIGMERVGIRNDVEIWIWPSALRSQELLGLLEEPF